MSFIIEDGKGTGFKCEVNSDNRLSVQSTVQARIADVSSHEGKAFGILIPPVTLTATPGAMLYFKNTSSVDSFFFSQMILSWNGGSTNHDRVAFAFLYYSMTEPSANHTAETIGNLNKGSSVAGSATAYYWDEVGTGMTVSTNGSLGGVCQLNQGTVLIQAQGSIIIPPSGTFGVVAYGEEVGEFSGMVTGHFEVAG